MRTPPKSVIVGILSLACPGPVLAYTINGTIPPGRAPVVINLHKPIRPGSVKFVFSAPAKNAGVNYALGFCIGPSANPCGLPISHVVTVPEGQARFAQFGSTLFATNILVVGQGTRVAVPFSVQISQ